MRVAEIVKRFVKDERGLETVEYAIIAALITIGAIVTIGLVGDEVAARFNDLLGALQDAAPPAA